VLTSLAYHIDLPLLKEAYRQTRKDGATGVDGQTAADYARDLDANLTDLRNRFKSGRYFAPPVRRVYIEKSNGKKRPLGIPTFEDKVLQRAVKMVLEAVYEQDFLDCSHGFRPNRSVHDALSALRNSVMEMRGGWILDVDIQAFFDTLDHRKLREFLDQRVRDGVLRRQIDKWLKAGILEGGELHRPTEGTPQGGVISPVLANIYLHVVLDLWFEREVRPLTAGPTTLIRYADDFVMVFKEERDARRVLEALPERFGRFGLTLHPEKTKLVRFERPTYGSRGKGDYPDGGRPETFDLLGFTHYWARSRNGNWVVKQRTAQRALSRAMRQVWDWCRRWRHLPIAVQHQKLNAKLRGHYQFYGVRCNQRQLACFHDGVIRAWRYWLDRRSQRGRMWWHRFRRLLVRYPLLPPQLRST
jgi:group II intron reverse transcriptase/maturase